LGLVPPLEDWKALQVLLHLKYGVYDEDELKMKMDIVRQEPKQKVQLYYDMLEKLFVKGKNSNVKRRR
jgi:hypothetical protein